MTQILHGQAPARGRTAVPVSIDLGHVDSDALEAKLHRLQDQIRSYGRLAIAFSGGVDSTLLVKVAQDVLGEDALAMTVQSPTLTEDDLRDVKAFYAASGINYAIVALNQLDSEAFSANGADRCYICKNIEFSSMAEEAVRRGIHWLASGVNADDVRDYRPGMKALAELGVVNPLEDVGLTKAEIRTLSRRFHLHTWNKPASSCLASRVAYGERITTGRLDMIAAGERALKRLGVRTVRVRYHAGDIARIEVAPEERRLLFDEAVMDEVAAAFKRIGFKYAALELGGYRSGSLNAVLDDDTKSAATPAGRR